ncbi:hypothetical protein VTI74DRAFT_734 [Chaetomium olivicolor]
MPDDGDVRKMPIVLRCQSRKRRFSVLCGSALAQYGNGSVLLMDHTLCPNNDNSLHHLQRASRLSIATTGCLEQQTPCCPCFTKSTTGAVLLLATTGHLRPNPQLTKLRDYLVQPLTEKIELNTLLANVELPSCQLVGSRSLPTTPPSPFTSDTKNDKLHVAYVLHLHPN